MILKVKVKTRSSEQKIVEFGDGRYLIYLESPPENNEANIELINLLSKHLGIPVGRIKIKLGRTNDEKVLEVF